MNPIPNPAAPAPRHTATLPITGIAYCQRGGGGAGGVADEESEVLIYSGNTLILKANARHIVRCVNSHAALVLAAQAAVRYDEAITACGNDPELMATFCTAQGDNLDALYADWIIAAHTALAQANARHIVRCVNSHTALVSALRELTETQEWLVSQRFLVPETDNEMFSKCLLALAAARTALQRATAHPETGAGE